MKLEIQGNHIETNIPIDDDISFSVDTSSYIIQEILRSRIYSEPIAAVVQEIISNAYDAHAEINNIGTPIQIFPIKDQFIIRDFGPGISPERMMNYYCRYGASTKRQTNEQLGCWGLGSKVYFAYYTRSAVVETIYDGTKYTYSARLDENNKGVITLFSKSQSDSNDRSGTTIKIPVKPEDISKFRQAILNTTMFWPTRPMFVGEPPLPIIKPIIDSNAWAIYGDDKINRFNVLNSIIPYIDDSHKIPSGVVLKFNIGELDVTADRLNLQYSDKTKLAIDKGLQTYDNEVTEKAQDQIDNLDSFHEVINIITSLPRAHIQRVWKWKDYEFKYPTEKSFIRYAISNVYRKSYISGNKTDMFHNLTKKSFIHLDKPEVTSYDKQRIRSYLDENNLKSLYLIEPGQFPVETIGLSTIKVPRKYGPYTKPDKTTIKGRKKGYRRQSDYLIDTPKRIIYCLPSDGDIDYINYIDKLGNLVQISERNEKYIINQPNWVHLKDYLQEELYDKVSKEEIQDIADKQLAIKTFNNFKFLHDHHNDFSCLDIDRLSKKYNSTILELVEYLVNNGIVHPTGQPIYIKYPLLKHVHISYYASDSDKKAVKDYVDLINRK